MISPDLNDSTHDKDDWLPVARHVNPLITDAEFDEQWEEFLAVKRLKESH